MQYLLKVNFGFEEKDEVATSFEAEDEKEATALVFHALGRLIRPVKQFGDDLHSLAASTDIVLQIDPKIPRRTRRGNALLSALDEARKRMSYGEKIWNMSLELCTPSGLTPVEGRFDWDSLRAFIGRIR